MSNGSDLMFCSSCGKQISKQSMFCSHCGAQVGTTPRATHNANPRWEYKELFIENSRFRNTYNIKYSHTYQNADQEDLWNKYKQQIPGLLGNEFAQGWEPDPAFWGVANLECEARNFGFNDSTQLGKILIVIFSFLTFGLMYILVMLCLRLMMFKVIEPTGVRIRLRREM